MDDQLLVGALSAAVAVLFSLSASSKIRELLTPSRRVSLFALIPGHSPRIKTLVTLTLVVLEVSIAIGLARSSRTGQVAALVLTGVYSLYIVVRHHSTGCAATVDRRDHEETPAEIGSWRVSL